MSILRTAVFAWLLAMTTLSHAAGNDDLWEITSKVEMAGMPFMPAQTTKVCTPKGKANEKGVPHDDNCKVTDYKQSGNKTTYKMVCTGENAMTGSGEIVVDGPNAYHGFTTMKGKMEGETIDMKSSFSSKRIDSCTAEDPEKYKKLAADMTAKSCRDSFDTLAWQIYIGNDASNACKPFKNEFCGRVAKITNEMKDPAVFEKQANKDWKGAMSACGQNSEPVAKAACDRGVSDSNWDFVGKYCPAETEALAKQHCEGRGYTALRSSPYAGICSQYAATNKGSATGSSNVLVDTISKQTGASTEAAGEALEAGKKALKGLFNF